MQKLKWIREPGYLFDLFFVFFYDLNPDYVQQNFCLDEEEAAQVQALTKELGECSRDLYVFFHPLEHGRIFMTRKYHGELLKQAPEAYSFSKILEMLADSRAVVEAVIRFYFHDLKTKTVEACIKSHADLTEQIRQSGYGDEVKIRLYEFFGNPEPYIQLLREELCRMERKLAAYYQKHEQKLLDCYQKLNEEQLCQDFPQESNMDKLLRDETLTRRYVSFCLLNRQLTLFKWNGNRLIVLLGIDYREGLKKKKHLEIRVALHELGAVLAEENRVKILELMLRQGEVSCKDLEREFFFSGSTAYHHLMTMLKYRLIRSRVEGKTVLYRINAEYFAASAKSIGRFSEAKEL